MTVHIIALLRRKPDVAFDAFSSHWLNEHLLAVGADKAESLPYYGYRQNHAVRTPETAALCTSTYDGFSDFYCEELEGWHAIFPSPRTPVAEADEDLWLAGQAAMFVCEDHVLVDGTPAEDAVKVLRPFRRRYDLRVRNFRPHWRDVYGPSVVATVPGIQRYVQAQVIDAAYRDAQPAWDGFDILWLDEVTAQLPQLLNAGHGDFLDDDPAPSIVVRELVPPCLADVIAAADREAGFMRVSA
jgi:hypothetical protein